MAEASEEEVPVEEAGGGEEAAQLLQRPLLQEAPTPLEGVDCGLPPGVTDDCVAEVLSAWDAC